MCFADSCVIFFFWHLLVGSRFNACKNNSKKCDSMVQYGILKWELKYVLFKTPLVSSLVISGPPPPALKFCGHVPQSALVFITGNTQYICMHSFCSFPLVTWQLYRFQMKYVAINPDHLSNPNSHNEGNMNNPIIIPCCLKNSGTVDGIFFFLFFLRLTLPFPFPLIWAGVSCSFPCFGAWVSFSMRGSCLCLIM